jgi:hypothetical protein
MKEERDARNNATNKKLTTLSGCSIGIPSPLSSNAPLYIS